MNRRETPEALIPNMSGAASVQASYWPHLSPAA